MTSPHRIPDDAAGRDAVIQAMCDAVDAGNPETFGSFFAVDASYRFGSGPEIYGRDAVIAATRSAIASMPWVRHHVDQVAHLGDQLFCRFTITTATAAGEEVAMPCVTVVWCAAGDIVDYRVHMDLSPLAPTEA